MKTKVALIMLLIVTMVVPMFGCSGVDREIKSLMTEFEYSCNKLDFDAMLNCIDPSIAEKIRLATGIAGMLINTDSDEILDKFSMLLTGDNSLDSGDFFSSIRFEILDVKKDGDTAFANGIVEYSISGQQYRKETVFNYIYTMEKWYILEINFV